MGLGSLGFRAGLTVVLTVVTTMLHLAKHAEGSGFRLFGGGCAFASGGARLQRDLPFSKFGLPCVVLPECNCSGFAVGPVQGLQVFWCVWAPTLSCRIMNFVFHVLHPALNPKPSTPSLFSGLLPWLRTSRWYKELWISEVGCLAKCSSNPTQPECSFLFLGEWVGGFGFRVLGSALGFGFRLHGV